VTTEDDDEVILRYNYHMNDSEVTALPWYRTRWFWGVVMGVLIVWALGYYIFVPYHSNLSTYDAFVGLSLSLGALPIGILLLKIFGEILSILVYYLIMISLLFMTLRKERVDIMYPIIFIFIFLFGHIFGIIFLGSFN